MTLVMRTARKHSTLASAVIFTWIPLCIGCAAKTPAREIEPILTRQAAAWNRGDIRGFMEDYVQSDELTFSSGGQTRRGWQATYDRYVQRYPDKAALGTLWFTDLETRPLGSSHAMTLGRWRLDRAQGPLSGNFTLVWRREGGGWRILHDHTSSDSP